MPDQPTSTANELWDRLVRDYWETKPGVFENVLSEPVMTEQECFDALVATAECTRQGRPAPTDFRCYVDGAMVANALDQLALFPIAADGDLRGYAARVSASLGGKKFGIISNQFVAASRPLWRRLHRLFSELVPRTGLPSHALDCALFLGNYDHTPFGIHRDPANILTFTIGPRKRILAWPVEYFASTPQLRELVVGPPDAGAARDAIELTMGPRDIMYWPPSHWHVAAPHDDDPAFCASLGCGLYMDGGPPGLITALFEAVDDLAKEHRALRELRFAPEACGVTDTLPPQLAERISTLKDLAANGALERAAHGAWLRRVTAAGMVPIPREPVPLTEGDAVRSTGDRILSATTGEQVLVAANGHCFELRPGEGVLRVLARLARGEEIVVGDENAAVDADARQLLEALLGVGAAVVVERSS
jgi:50S ribosomal protein L16 3-hydroxylase